jgi:DNA-directed RNA polymerase subunit RPC12/RpoP
MWWSDVYLDFKCPLCGSNGYVRVRVKKPDGSWYTTEFYKCASCTAMFTDPVEFTKQEGHQYSRKPPTAPGFENGPPKSGK